MSKRGLGKDGKHIKAARIKRGWTQAKLAEKLGVTQAQVSNMESADNLESATWRKVMAVLPIPEMAALLEDTPDEEQTGDIKGVQVPKWLLRLVSMHSASEPDRASVLESVLETTRLLIQGPPEFRRALEALICLARR